jgi:hypothetical protein
MVRSGCDKFDNVNRRTSGVQAFGASITLDRISDVILRWSLIIAALSSY